MDAHTASTLLPEQHYSLTLEQVTPRSPGQLRRVIGALLETWGQAELVDDAQFVATELLTNVLKHAGPKCRVVLSAGSYGAHIHVRDFSTTLPIRRPASDTQENGRGIQAVGRCATLTVQRLPRGKIVAAFLAAPDRRPKTHHTG